MTRKQFWIAALLAIGALALVACGSSESTPTPASDAAAAPAQVSRIYVYADTVIGSSGMTDEEKPLRSCTEQSRFAPGEQLGWRIKVYDAATGAELKDTDIASVQIKLGDGQVFDAEYAGHGRPEPTDFFWANFWVIPDDYPTGLLPYTITATANDGRTAEFTSNNINIDASKLTIQEKS